MRVELLAARECMVSDVGEVLLSTVKLTRLYSSVDRLSIPYMGWSPTWRLTGVVVVRTEDAEDWAVPSLVLWTRGHVLTHYLDTGWHLSPLRVSLASMPWAAYGFSSLLDQQVWRP